MEKTLTSKKAYITEIRPIKIRNTEIDGLLSRTEFALQSTYSKDARDFANRVELYITGNYSETVCDFVNEEYKKAGWRDVYYTKTIVENESNFITFKLYF